MVVQKDLSWEDEGLKVLVADHYPNFLSESPFPEHSLY